MCVCVFVCMCVFQACSRRGCYYCETTTVNVPWCFLPRSHGYRQTSKEDNEDGFTLQLERVNTPSWFGADLNNLRFDVIYHNNERLQIRVSIHSVWH